MAEPRIILVTGSRDWPITPQGMWDVFKHLDLYAENVDVIVEGCARGVDSIAERWAKAWLIQNDHYPADWTNPKLKNPYSGKSFAGNDRNQQMLDETLEKYGKYPDLVMAFHPDIDRSRGTKDMVEKANNVGIPIEYFKGM